MNMAQTQANPNQAGDAAAADVTVLLLDSPENEGVDFLQALQRMGMQFTSERVNDKDSLFAALKKRNWDILLVNDQVTDPGVTETLDYLRQIKKETGYLLLSSKAITIDFLTECYQQGIAAVVSGLHPDYSFEVFGRAAERSRRNFQLSQLNQEKFELAKHRDQLMSGTEEALAYLADGIHVYGNDAYMKMLGYTDPDDLIIMPFIDIVSTEMREKVKQLILDFQQAIRVNPDTEPMVMPELFVETVGEKEGIIDVTATFKPVTYDGEECIQVVFKDNSVRTEKEGGLGEGLGYPLFMSHLGNYIAEARETSALVGQVVHVRGNGFEHYIAGKGFGSLNGKMKALSSELKAGLGDDDFMIRFTENSFLILIKGDDAEDQQKIAAQKELLGKFEAALNKEIGLKDQEPLVTFTHDVTPVDASSESAEQLIKSFLMGAEPATDAEEIAAAPPADKVPEAAPASEPPASKPEAEQAAAEPAPADPEPAAAPETEPEPEAVAAPAADEPASQFNQSAINTAMNSGGLSIYYEPLISVTDIETEFYDLALYMNDGKDKLTREAVGSVMAQSPLAGKLDLWGLQQAVKVIVGLYSMGEEYRVVLPMHARSLVEKRLPDSVNKEISVMHEGMVVLDFDMRDITTDTVAHCNQLDSLREAGVWICVSGVDDFNVLQDILQHAKINLVRLKTDFVRKAVANEELMKKLGQAVDKLHGHRIRVFAGDIDNSDLLSACCKMKMDLVKGEYIQKTPLELTADALSQDVGL